MGGLAADLPSTFLVQPAALKAPLPQQRPDDYHAFLFVLNAERLSRARLALPPFSARYGHLMKLCKMKHHSLARHLTHTVQMSCRPRGNNVFFHFNTNPHIFHHPQHEMLIFQKFFTHCHGMLAFSRCCQSHHKKVRRYLGTRNFAPQACSCWHHPCWHLFTAADFATKQMRIRYVSHGGVPVSVCFTRSLQHNSVLSYAAVVARPPPHTSHKSVHSLAHRRPTTPEFDKVSGSVSCPRSVTPSCHAAWHERCSGIHERGRLQFI